MGPPLFKPEALSLEYGALEAAVFKSELNMLPFCGLLICAHLLAVPLRDSHNPNFPALFSRNRLASLM
jgi:hypothetical protein